MTPPKKDFSYSDGITLREHLETIINSQKEYFESRLAAMDKAVNVSRVTMETRLEGMNEFRNSLKDQSGTFITRTELTLTFDKLHAEIKGLAGRIEGLELYKSSMEGKASQMSVNIAYLISIISIIFGIINLWAK